MEGYEIYRLSDEEIQHVGVKGMKWGKRKSRSAYMQKVDAHENKTKSVAATKSTAGSAKRKAYMDAVNAHEKKSQDISNAKVKEKQVKKQISDSVKTSKLKENYTKSIEADKVIVKNVADKVLGKELRDRNASYLKNASAKREVKGAARKQLAKARAKDLSEKLSKGLNIAVAVNDVYGDISPTGLKNHFANAEQLEKYGIEYKP